MNTSLECGSAGGVPSWVNTIGVLATPQIVHSATYSAVTSTVTLTVSPLRISSLPRSTLMVGSGGIGGAVNSQILPFHPLPDAQTVVTLVETSVLPPSQALIVFTP